MSGYLARPATNEKLPALVSVFDAFGVGAEMKRVTDDFASAGYVVFMPDLFSRGSWISCIRVLIRDALKGEGRSVEDLKAARNWLAARDYVDAQRLGVIGFCLGGGFALLLSKTGLFQVAAPFYGKVPARMDGACPLVASFGGLDKQLAADVPKLEAEVKRLGLEADIKVYPNAGHGFMSEPPKLLRPLMRLMHAGYEPESAADATKRVVAFLQQHL